MNSENTKATGTLTKWWMVIVVVAVLGAGAWYALSADNDSTQDIPRRLSAEHTIASVSITNLDASYRRVLRALRAFPTVEGAWSMLWGQPKKSGQDFDPSKAATWKNLGIDPEVGAALTLDARLISKDTVVPLLWVGTPDLEPSIKFLAEWSGHPLPIISGQSFKSVVIGGARIIFAAKGDITVLTMLENSGSESVDAAVKRLGLAQVLGGDWGGKGPSLAESKRYRRALSDSVGQKHVALYFDFENLRKRLDQSTLGPSFKPITSYVSQWMEATAIQFGDKGAIARVVTTTPGQTLAEQLISVKGSTPRFARRLGDSSWSALRWSINLKQVLDGLGQALPPSTPEQIRMSVGMVRIALPMATGISWESLCRAFTGHFMVALRPGKTEPDPSGFLFAAQVADGTSADSVLASAVGTLKKRSPGAEPKETEIAGVKGWSLSVGEYSGTFLRHDDMLLFGSTDVVEAAIKSAKTKGKTPPALTDLDGQAVFGVVVDGTPFIPKELAKTVTDDRELMAFVTNPIFSMKVTLDNRGLLWSQTRPSRLEDLLAFLAAVPSISLPFEFPVSL